MPEYTVKEQTARRLSFLINLAFFGSIAAACWLVGRMVVHVLLPFAYAFIAAAVVQKPIGWLKKRCSFTHTVAATVVSSLALLLVGAGIVFTAYRGGVFLFRLLQQEQTQEAIQALAARVNDTLSGALQNLLSLLPQQAAETVANATASLGEGLLANGASLLASFSGDILRFATDSLPRFLLSSLFFVLAFVFFARDFSAVCACLRRQIPTPHRPLVKAAVIAIKETTLSALKAYCILGVITFAEMAVGLWLLGLPLPLLLALITAIVDALPVLGVGTVLLPIAVFRLLSGNIGGGIGVLILYALSTVTRHFLQPRLLSRETGLPPLITLLAMYVGWRLAGLPGLLLAPIAAMVILRLQREGHLHLFR